MKTIVHNGVEYLLPPCPQCQATAKRCKRPSGHDAAGWHVARVEEFDRLNPAVTPASEDGR